MIQICNCNPDVAFRENSGCTDTHYVRLPVTLLLRYSECSTDSLTPNLFSTLYPTRVKTFYYYKDVGLPGAEKMNGNKEDFF